jgi:hypothetical protein
VNTYNLISARDVASDYTLGQLNSSIVSTLAHLSLSLLVSLVTFLDVGNPGPAGARDPLVTCNLRFGLTSSGGWLGVAGSRSLRLGLAGSGGWLVVSGT